MSAKPSEKARMIDPGQLGRVVIADGLTPDIGLSGQEQYRYLVIEASFAFSTHRGDSWASGVMLVLGVAMVHNYWFYGTVRELDFDSCLFRYSLEYYVSESEPRANIIRRRAYT